MTANNPMAVLNRKLIIQDKSISWKLLAIRAGYIRFGMIGKY
jgi:hypothetical protein